MKDVCVICLDKSNDLSHCYFSCKCSVGCHKECIKKWIEVEHKCPICCEKLPEKEVFYNISDSYNIPILFFHASFFSFIFLIL